jgi:hypothetical protein
VVDLDRYLQAVFEVMNAGPEGRPSLFYIAHAALRHRDTQAMRTRSATSAAPSTPTSASACGRPTSGWLSAMAATMRNGRALRCDASGFCSDKPTSGLHVPMSGTRLRP